MNGQSWMQNNKCDTLRSETKKLEQVYILYD
jgi:hypothetical protein